MYRCGMKTFTVFVQDTLQSIMLQTPISICLLRVRLGVGLGLVSVGVRVAKKDVGSYLPHIFVCSSATLKQ